MNIADIKNKTVEELSEMLSETRHELASLRFRAREGQLKDVRAIREARATIAQLLTLLHMQKRTA